MPEQPSADYPLANVILYGPPGTGKTYHAKNYAVAAVRNLPPAQLLADDRASLTRAFRQLSERGQIQFVTFHQSFSYEDFVEGIKPDLTAGQSDLRYVLQDGIFKRLCTLATYALWQARHHLATHPDRPPTPPPDFETLYLEFMAAQLNLLKRQVAVTYATKRGREATLLSVNAKGNLSLRTDGRAYVVTRGKLQKLYAAFPRAEAIARVGTDIARTVGGGNASLYWAVFTELKEFEKRLAMAGQPTQLAEADLPEGEPSYATKARVAESFDWTALTPDALAHADRFALVIDEINRGNLSQIFGELISLLEPDKRGGRPEALSARLPYSKTNLVVPPNLLLIGTMNTADRSVETLDAALRRRFTFVEMRPDYDWLAARFGTGPPDLARLLRTVNQRIGALLGKDYAIGHAYFADLTTASDLAGLKHLFQHRLLPLLEEYFYGNEGRLERTVGEDFFEKTRPGERFAPTQYEVREDAPDYPARPLRNAERMPDADFLKALVRIYEG